MTLGLKQRTSHEDFVRIYQTCLELVSRDRLEALFARTVHEIKVWTSGAKTAFGWSGGKDSLALQLLCEAADVTECVFVMTNLEFPEFLQWTTDHMPEGLTVKNNGWDLAWLAAHPSLLFPMTSPLAAKWYAGVQWRGQEEYFLENELDMLVVGRRRKDGNQIGLNGMSENKKGVVRFSPMRDWTHEEVFALLRYRGVELPPIYDWPRSFRVGSGPWPARRYCESVEAGWHEVWTVDAMVVREAAAVIPSAAAFLGKFGLI